jgi:hypothetical protein
MHSPLSGLKWRFSLLIVGPGPDGSLVRYRRLSIWRTPGSSRRTTSKRGSLMRAMRSDGSYSTPSASSSRLRCPPSIRMESHKKPPTRNSSRETSIHPASPPGSSARDTRLIALSGTSRLVPKVGLKRILLLFSTAACRFQLKMPSPTRIGMITTNGNRVGHSAPTRPEDSPPQSTSPETLSFVHKVWIAARGCEAL